MAAVQFNSTHVIIGDHPFILCLNIRQIIINTDIIIIIIYLRVDFIPVNHRLSSREYYTIILMAPVNRVAHMCLKGTLVPVRTLVNS